MTLCRCLVPFLLVFAGACSSPDGEDSLPDSEGSDAADTDMGAIDARQRGDSDEDLIAGVMACNAAIDEYDVAIESARSCDRAVDCVIARHPACESGGQLAVATTATEMELAVSTSELDSACSDELHFLVDRHLCTDFGSGDVTIACEDNACRIAHEVTVTGTITFEFDDPAPESFTYDLYIRKDGFSDEYAALLPDRGSSATEVDFEITATVGEGAYVVGARVGDWGEPLGEARISDWTAPVEIEAIVVAP